MFKVIDRTTGKEPDFDTLSHEEWVQKHLVYCDLEGFTIGNDGTIYLLDECGNWVYAPPERFTVVPV